MDQFSHDLTVALEETSLLDRVRVSRWGQHRRRTRSTGNLPCAPQPTEDSSSPTDVAQGGVVTSTTNNNDGLDTCNINLPVSDSDDKDNDVIRGGGSRLSYKSPLINVNTSRLCTLESDSLNETFSPARFFKPNTRRKRKLKRITMDYGISPHREMRNNITSIITTTSTNSNSALRCTANVTTEATRTATILYPLPTSAVSSSGAIRKRLLRSDSQNRSQLFFCGKRKRSNRDRYHDHTGVGLYNDHTTLTSRIRNICNNNNNNNNISNNNNNNNIDLDDFRMRSRSFSSTSSKLHSNRVLPLNKGLLSKIERISQQQQRLKGSNLVVLPALPLSNEELFINKNDNVAQLINNEDSRQQQHNTCSQNYDQSLEKLNFRTQLIQRNDCQHRHHRQRQRRRLLQFPIEGTSLMDCEDFNEFSSSSLSSSESDDNHATNDTDREGDDELTDWPGNEPCGIGGVSTIDYKRKLTKRSTLPQIKSDPESVNTLIMTEGDALMSQGPNVDSVGDFSKILWPTSPFIQNNAQSMELPYQTSEPIAIIGSSNRLLSNAISDRDDRKIDDNPEYCNDTVATMPTTINDINIPLKQIESELSGETSANPFLSSSPPYHIREIREIRAGCRRIKGERPGFSIKTSVNERLARFLHDPRQIQIRLPDIEICEHDSLINLATLYSLHMSLDNGCAILKKTSNTTQSVNIDRQGLQNRLLLSDFKRRCYETKSSGNDLLPK